MAQRPNREPAFAYAPPAGALVEPPSGARAAGFAAAQKPAAQWLNYLLNLWGAWINYLRGPHLGNWTRRALPVTWDAPAMPTRRLVLGVDAATPDRDVPAYRYLLAGEVSSGIRLFGSARGADWSEVTGLLPVGADLTTYPVRGVAALGAFWFVWTQGEVWRTSRDTTAGVSGARPGGPLWTAPALPAGYVVDLACDEAAPSWAMLTTGLGSGAAEFAQSTDGGVTFGAQAYTGGPPTGAGLALAWTGSYYVAITATGQVWRTPNVTTNYALAATRAASAGWQLAVGRSPLDAPRLVAYQTGTTTPVVEFSDDHGATWTAVAVPAVVRNLTRLRWVDGAWVATSADAPFVWGSNDLVTWDRAVVPVVTAVDALYDFAYGEGAVLAVGLGASYQSGRAVAPGAGSPAGGVAGLVGALSDAVYLRGRLLEDVTPADGAMLVWDAAAALWRQATRVGAAGVTTDYPGGQRTPPRKLTGAGPHAAGAGDFLVWFAGAGTQTYTLPAPSNGRTLVFKDAQRDAATNNKTIARNGSELIDGVAANIAITTNGGKVTLVSDGTNWEKH